MAEIIWSRRVSVVSLFYNEVLQMVRDERLI